MSILSPPSYTESLNPEHKPNGIIKLSPQIVIKEDKEFQKALSDPELRSLLSTEILGLAKSALTIDESFRQVTRQLGQLLPIADQQKEKETITGLKANWEEKHKLYIDLLWKSRETASSAKAAADDFAGVFIKGLKKPSVTLEKKREKIQAKIRKMEADENEGMKLSQAFKELREWVKNFKEDLTSVADVLKEQKNTRLQELQKELERLNSSMDSIITEITELLKRFKSWVSGGIKSLLSKLCPEFLSKVHTKLSGEQQTQFKSKADRKEELEKEIEKCKEEIATVKKDEESISLAVQEIGTNASKVMDKLALFGKVWAAIVADLRQIEKTLKMNVDEDDEDDFEERLDTIAEQYKTLSYALRVYQTTVDVDDPLLTARSAD